MRACEPQPRWPSPHTCPAPLARPAAQERERKKLAAARRSQEAAMAVRSRAEERQREVERNLAEQVGLVVC
jgi:hypothetical protein